MHTSVTGARAAAPRVPAGPARAAPNQAGDDLGQLVALHYSGQLSDTEFAAAKTRW